MFRKKEKGLDTTLSRGDLLDIKNVLSSSEETFTLKETRKILRLLLGRSNFDYEMVVLLKKHNTDLNAPIDDENGYRIGDYLASYGRLSPRLIHEMSKAGYDFKKTNKTGEHAGFYLHLSSPVNARVVSALKAQGVDFSIKNNKGEAVEDKVLKSLKYHAYKTKGTIDYQDVAFQRLSALIDTRDDTFTFVNVIKDEEKLKAFIASRFAHIKPEEAAYRGISSIKKENGVRMNLVKYTSHFVGENNKLSESLRQSYICTQKNPFPKSTMLRTRSLTDN